MGAISALLLLPGSAEFIVAFDNQMMQHWSLARPPAEIDDGAAPPPALQPTLLRSWKAHEAPVRALATDSTTQLLGSAGADRTVLVRDVAREHFTHVLRGHVYVVTALVFHPVSARHMLLSGDEGGVLYRWNLLDRKGVAVDEAHTSAVTAIAITPDGKRAVSAGRDSVLSVWDLSAAAGLSILHQIVTNERIEGLCVISDGTHIATAGERGFVRVWPVASGAELRVCDSGGLGEFTSLAASRDGRVLFGTTSDLTFARFSVGAAGQVRRDRVLVGDYDAVIDACFFGHEQVAVATNSNLVRIIDLETLGCTMLAGHTDLVMALAIGGKGTRLATCAKDHTLRVYELAEKRAPRCIAVCVGHTESVGAVACTAAAHGDGAFVISGSRDTTLKVWRVDAPTKALRSATAAEEQDDDGLVVRDDSRGNEPARPRALTTRSAHDKEINCVVVSPDDNVVASGSQDRSIRLWRLPKLEAIGQLLGHKRGVWSLRFAPREKLLASASGDKTLRLWSLADNTCVRTFEGHATPVLRVAFISAGQQLLSTSGDGVLKLWNVSDSACVNTFDAHEARPWALAERGDGAQLLTGGEDGALVLWRDRSAQDAAEVASKRAERIVGEQSLLNHERRGELATALALAIKLDVATRARSIINRMLDDGAADVPLPRGDADAESDGAPPPSQLMQCVRELDDELLTRLLLWVRDWHATTRVATAGVRVLRAVLLARSPEQLMALPEMRTAMVALLPYAVRHRRRAAELAQRAQLLAYVASAAGAGTVFASFGIEQETRDAVLTIANDDVLTEQAATAAAATASQQQANKRARV